MNLKKIIAYVLLIAMLFFVPWLTWTCVYHETRVTVPIEKEIENSIPMQELENKFVEVHSVNFGGAGAGGLGAPQMFAFSAKQFLNNTGDEKIYSAVVLTNFNTIVDMRATVYKKTYWAFIENRAGIIVYEKTHSLPGFVIEGYDDNNVYFFGTNGWIAFIVTIVVFVALICIEIRIADSKWFYRNIEAHKENK